MTTIPPRVEYALNPLGSRVAARVGGLVDLLEEIVPEVAAAQREHDARTGGTGDAPPAAVAGSAVRT